MQQDLTQSHHSLIKRRGLFLPDAALHTHNINGNPIRLHEQNRRRSYVPSLFSCYGNNHIAGFSAGIDPVMGFDHIIKCKNAIDYWFYLIVFYTFFYE